MDLSSRTWIPAMVPWRATSDGFVTPQVLAWYRRFAEGKPGAIVVEATGIRDIPSGPLLRISHDRYLPGLRELARTVHDASGGKTRVLIQIIDFLPIRRRPTKEAFFGRFVQITSELMHAVHGSDEASARANLVAMSDADLARILPARELESYQHGYRERVTDMHLESVRGLPETLPALFADAAARAQDAGFDGVELHYAHAYTMASFLSAKNTRDDGYGGARENRLRLPIEVYQRVRDRVGESYPLGCRFLTDEVIEGGSHIEDAVYFGTEFARAGMDFLSLSKGGKFEDAKQPALGHAAYPYTGESGHECMPTVRIATPGPFARNIPLAARITHAVRSAGFQTPIIAGTGISSFWQAEEILQRGDVDVVSAARQSLADPDWFEKMRQGRGDEIRRCFFTNYCEGLDQAHKSVTCQRWDREDLDTAPPQDLSADGKRRLIAPAWR
jgi:2,4-dienoyl-CoA reductase-like NADH-dependent reductase (Old Yellow Enzyme family)